MRHGVQTLVPQGRVQVTGWHRKKLDDRCFATECIQHSCAFRGAHIDTVHHCEAQDKQLFQPCVRAGD